jgi:membrane-associated protease RseP (regulator of RpoE activity)
LLALVAKVALGDTLAEGHRLLLHPLAFAGWLGLLVTALNLLPIGQLDGGHIADAMFGRARSAAIGTAALVALFFLGLFVWSGLLTWALIVYFIAGGKGIPPSNDVSRLGAGRLAIGAFAFILLFLILAPVPHRFCDSLGIHCPYL